nr:NAD(+) diphosphatase [Pseudoroseicyclus aestuarii]
MTFGGLGEAAPASAPWPGLARAAELRGDEAALRALAGRPGARWIVFWQGRPLVREGGLVRLPAGHPVLPEATQELFLGLEAGEGVWALDLGAWQPPEGPEEAADPTLRDGALPDAVPHPDLPGAAFTALRAVMAELDAAEAGQAAAAKAVLDWHVSHRFCARCGHESAARMAGWQRDCPACGTHHFPRTDPVVITLVTRGDRVLLGRGPRFPETMFSLLAGFVEPGETVEAAVRREVWEETRVQLGRVDYLSSQPWPFPANLMIGCHAEALSEEITPDPTEIVEALWVDKERLARIFAGRDPEIRTPRHSAIAGFLLWNWLADRLD